MNFWQGSRRKFGEAWEEAGRVRNSVFNRGCADCQFSGNAAECGAEAVTGGVVT